MAADYTDEELERGARALWKVDGWDRLSATWPEVQDVNWVRSCTRAVLDAVVPSIVERVHGEYEQVGWRDVLGKLHSGPAVLATPVFVRRSTGETT